MSGSVTLIPKTAEFVKRRSFIPEERVEDRVPEDDQREHDHTRGDKMHGPRMNKRGKHRRKRNWTGPMQAWKEASVS